LSLLATMVFSGKPHYVIPVNPELVMTARRNTLFRNVINDASLVLPDGIGVVIASWIMCKPITERVTGVDTVQDFAALAHKKGLRLFLLGAAPGVAECVAERLQAKYPGLEIVGTYAGSPDPAEEDEICKRIAAAKPQILLVAYGAPKQELWVARNLKRLNVPVTLCVGGTFDFIAGIASRAPIWIRRIGLEWLYRLIQEPHRWRRMTALPRFVFAVLWYRLTTFMRSDV
jgi:N-acetylglucosaminyldiphosphoundecaprenol N-acetyl-beta-D-mannosaminyltransferase